MATLNLDPETLDRYSRQVIMDDVGPSGQATLLDANVLVVGAGGLGSPVIQYLAAAGVGQLTLIDSDEVERSNLHRQVIHGVSDIGRSKVDSAAAYVANLNPELDVTSHRIRVSSNNVSDFVADHEVVVDASDNFQTRFLLNDACTLNNVPLSHGAVYRFEGQVTTFSSDGSGPCYRCIFPEAPPPGTIPDCSETGVLGVVPGTIGTIQATEVIKLLIDHGKPLEGRLLAYDATSGKFEEVSIERQPDCPVCGEDGIESVREIDYEGTCAIGD